MQTSKTCALKQLILKICNNWYFLLSLPPNRRNREPWVKQTRGGLQCFNTEHRGATRFNAFDPPNNWNDLWYKGNTFERSCSTYNTGGVKYSKIIHFLVTRRRKKAGNSEAQSKEKAGEPTAYSSQDFKPIHRAPLYPISYRNRWETSSCQKIASNVGLNVYK